MMQNMLNKFKDLWLLVTHPSVCCTDEFWQTNFRRKEKFNHCCIEFIPRYYETH